MMDDERGALVEDKDIPYSVQLQLIKKRTERGMSPLQIARLMGLKKKEIQAVVNEHGWQAKREVEEERKGARKTEAQIERERLARRVRQYAEKGMTRMEIAEKVGKSPDYIKNLGAQHSIKFKRPKSAKYRSLFFYNDLKQLEAKGLTKKQMAIELKTSEQTVRDCFNFFEKGDKP